MAASDWLRGGERLVVVASPVSTLRITFLSLAPVVITIAITAAVIVTTVATSLVTSIAATLVTTVSVSSPASITAVAVTAPLLVTPVVVPPLVSSTGSETSVTTTPVPWWPLSGLVDRHGASLQLEPGHLRDGLVSFFRSVHSDKSEASWPLGFTVTDDDSIVYTVLAESLFQIALVNFI